MMRADPTTRPPRPAPRAASRARRLAAPALAVAAAVSLAACGSSGSSSKSSTPKASSTTKAPSAAAVVKTASNAQLGTILVDSDGKTLYTLTSNGAAVACTGACLAVWPPLLLPSGTTTATGASDVTGLGTVAASGGTQVTQVGLPLYHFARDTAAGDATGEGINSFGGVWHVVKVGGGSETPGGASGGAGASSSSTTTTTNSSGY